MFVTLHTNVIVVTIRISIADLIGEAATQTFAPGSKHPRAASGCSIETAERIELGFLQVSFLPPVLHCVKRKFGYLQK